MTGGTWRLTTTLDMQVLNLRPTMAATESASNQRAVTGSLAFGTAANQFGDAVSFLYPLMAGQSVTFDLYDGSTGDAFNEAMNLRLLKAWVVGVSSGGDSSGVTVSGGDSNPHGLFMGGTLPTQTAYPSGPAVTGGSPAGSAVTSTARTVKVANNGAVPVICVIGFAGTPAVSGVPMGLAGLLLTYP